MSSDAYIGIDPGLCGAIACITERRLSADVYDLCADGKLDPIMMHQVIVGAKAFYGSVAVAIELQHPMPRQGSVSGFALGRHYGQLLGVLAVLRVPVREVRAREWQRAMLPGHARGETKQASLARASILWPHVELTTKRGRKLDGRSDALLIAEWLRLELCK